MALHFYAQRKTVKNDTGATPINYYYGTRDEAERQFHLLCAAAIANTDANDITAVEYGTVEQGAVERKVYIREIQPEPEVEQPEGE